MSERLPDWLHLNFMKSDLLFLAIQHSFVRSFFNEQRQHHILVDFHINPKRKENKWGRSTKHIWSHKSPRQAVERGLTWLEISLWESFFPSAPRFSPSFNATPIHAIILSSNHRHTFRFSRLHCKHYALKSCGMSSEMEKKAKFWSFCWRWGVWEIEAGWVWNIKDLYPLSCCLIFFFFLEGSFPRRRTPFHPLAASSCSF